MRKLIALALVAVAIGACSSKTGNGGNGSLDSAQAVYTAIQRAGIACGALQHDTQPGIMTKESDSCERSDGSAIYIYIPTQSTGENPDLEKSWLSMAELGGGFTVYDAQHFRWVVGVDDRATADKIAKALGGTVR